MKLSENAQTECNKCRVYDDVANMKADGNGKFLCIECAYAQLEARLEQWEQEAEDGTVMRDAGGRPMTEIEHWWMDEKKENLKLKAENEALRELLEEGRDLILRMSYKLGEAGMWETILGRIDALLTGEQDDENVVD